MKDMLQRLIRLKAAEIKIQNKVKTLKLMSGKDKYLTTKLQKLEARLVEYKESINNLETYGWEKTPSENPVSVEIEVPLGKEG